MDNIDLLDSAFDPKWTLSYHLSLQLTYHGFTYAILSLRKPRKYLYLKHVHFEEEVAHDRYCDKLQSLFAKEALLLRKYKSVACSFLTPKSTLVPNSFFSSADLKTYFTYNHILADYDEIHFNKLKRLDAHNVFSIPNCVSNLVLQRYPNATFCHQSTPLIEAALAPSFDEKKPKPETFGAIAFHGDFFDMLVVNNKKLKLYNSFLVRDAADFVYYVLYVYQQLNLDQEAVPVILYGDIDHSSPAYVQLYKFIRTIEFATWNPEVEYSKQFKKLDKQAFSLLFDMHRCV